MYSDDADAELCIRITIANFFSYYYLTALNAMDEKMITAAIDMGTTYCGVACSWKHDPSTIFVDRNMMGNLISARTSKCILFTKDKRFHAFGYDAEAQYLDLVEEDMHNAADWFFFKLLKGTLSKKNVSTISVVFLRGYIPIFLQILQNLEIFFFIFSKPYFFNITSMTLSCFFLYVNYLTFYHVKYYFKATNFKTNEPYSSKWEGNVGVRCTFWSV